MAITERDRILRSTLRHAAPKADYAPHGHQERAASALPIQTSSGAPLIGLARMLDEVMSASLCIVPDRAYLTRYAC